MTSARARVLAVDQASEASSKLANTPLAKVSRGSQSGLLTPGLPLSSIRQIRPPNFSSSPNW
jgi:hypothetical protein